MHPAATIAIVEDDPGLLADLLEFMLLRGFAAHGFASAEEFFAVWPASKYKLLLLDTILPGASGLEIARRVRAHPEQHGIGIVMLTALDANHDQIAGFDAGADLYLSKRSSLDLIEAACNGVLRRINDAQPQAAHWRLHSEQWQLYAPCGIAVNLTNAQLQILKALCQNPGKAVTRTDLLACLGKQDTLFNLRNLDNATSRLRRKVFTNCGQELPLRSSYGQGYTFAARCELIE